MARSRVLIQGALIFALMLAGVTTLFVRSPGGSGDLAAPIITMSPTTPTTQAPPSPTPSFDTEPTAKPDVKPMPRVKPSTPLTKQEAKPIGVYKIWQPEAEAPRGEERAQPVRCSILKMIKQTIEGETLTAADAKAMDARCVKDASVVSVYAQPAPADLL